MIHSYQKRADWLWVCLQRYICLCLGCTVPAGTCCCLPRQVHSSCPHELSGDQQVSAARPVSDWASRRAAVCGCTSCRALLRLLGLSMQALSEAVRVCAAACGAHKLLFTLQGSAGAACTPDGAACTPDADACLWQWCSQAASDLQGSDGRSSTPGDGAASDSNSDVPLSMASRFRREIAAARERGRSLARVPPG